ncbi:MAG: cobalamin synthesis protein P47K [Proteiniphilum sp.]|jgi:Ni2+-binding GTPase involved in maturation of urease and hydrogenase|nr:cobalamin synthesis protein P47K [Proteiniphilum sp.]
MNTTKLIIAGGFLGAGKTTLLLEAARRLAEQGLRTGLITNDQAPELVDSKWLSLNNIPVEEVSGSCFCCNFDGFTDAIRKIRAGEAADVIIAEPVGSCTDLSATIMQPLKRFWNRDLQIAPLTVLADPVRLGPILAGGNAGLHPDAAYIYRKQLEESDIILINKADLQDEEEIARLKRHTAEAYPFATLHAVSAMTGAGIDAWLQEVTTRRDAGKRLVEMDYDIYASGEAVLGWLNGTLRLSGRGAGNCDRDWDAFTRDLLAALAARFDAGNLTVGHVKAITENGSRFVTGNLTGSAESLRLRGSAGCSPEAKLTLNARVETSPGNLDRIVRDTLNRLCPDAPDAPVCEVLAWRYLQPGRPQPTHRFSETV